MITGFNHNIKHNGTVYHIQTEDSGIKAPHIITHLFVGGNIIATKKTSYSDLVGSANLDQVVRKMMEEQHKQMLRNLIHGTYDQAASESIAPPPRPRATTQALPRVAPAPVDIPAPTAAIPAAATAAAATAAETDIANPFYDVGITPPDETVPAAMASEIAPELAADTDNPFADQNATQPMSEPAVPAPAVTAPAEPSVPPPAGPPAEILPAPPATTWAPVLRPLTAAAQPPAASTAQQQQQPTVRSLWDPWPRPEPTREPPPEVIAARALSEKPVEMPAPNDTIFGEDLLDEKSLDEVILSYLADDENE